MVKYFLTTAILFVVPNIMSVNYAYAAGTAYLSDTYDTYGLRSTIDPAKDKQVFSWTGGYGGVFLGSANSTTTATETRTVGDDTDLCAPAGTPDVPVGMF